MRFWLIKLRCYFYRYAILVKIRVGYYAYRLAFNGK